MLGLRAPDLGCKKGGKNPAFFISSAGITWQQERLP
jgi:hypothetical protein